MDDFSNSVMVALLPTTSDWCKIELPHCTLVYVGEILDLKSSTHNELIKTAINVSFKFTQVMVKVIGIDVLGDEDKVDVLLLEKTKQLLSMRKVFEKWNVSEYDFKPHCTVGPRGSITEMTPLVLNFDKILIAWGEQQTIYELGRTTQS